MDGFVVDAAGVASCLASARSVASSCGCAGGGAARWVDDARCACDVDAAAESCDAVLARAPGRGVLVAPGGLQYGFTTALNDFVGHLAAAYDDDQQRRRQQPATVMHRWAAHRPLRSRTARTHAS